MTTRPIRLLAGFATVGGWTMASRILGFLRDMAIARLLGTGPAAEAFFVAFRLPNMFRRFFAEGAFNLAFVPMFAGRLEGEGRDAARRFGEEAQAGLATVLLVFVVIAQALMPWFVWGLASGLDGERFELATVFSRICFPYIFLISLAALLSGVLNSLGRFAAAAAAPVLLNIVLLGAMGIGHLADWPIGWVLAWAVPVAGLAQLVLVAEAARRAGMGLRLVRPRWSPEMKRLLVVGLPAALAGGVMQINLVVGTQIASQFEGAVGWLWYADRVYQLPLGVVGVAIGVVLLPELTRRLRADDPGAAAASMNRSAEFALALTLPATLALVAIPVPIVDALFGGGVWTGADTEATALALLIYAIGLPAFVLQKILQPAFFAREDTRTPLRIAVISMIVNAVLAVGLMPVAGFLAAAIATTAAGWANLALLWVAARRLGPEIAVEPRLAARLVRMLVAAGGMGAIVFLLDQGLDALIPGQSLLILVILVATGIASYGILAIVLGAFRPADLKAAVTRREREG